MVYKQALLEMKEWKGLGQHVRGRQLFVLNWCGLDSHRIPIYKPDLCPLYIYPDAAQANYTYLGFWSHFWICVLSSERDDLQPIKVQFMEGLLYYYLANHSSWNHLLLATAFRGTYGSRLQEGCHRFLINWKLGICIIISEIYPLVDDEA